MPKTTEITKTLDNVEITVPADMCDEEIMQYIAHVRQGEPKRTLKTLTIELDGEDVNLRSTFTVVPFTRLRRVTGYLSTLSRFNNAKRHEEADRTKHG